MKRKIIYALCILLIGVLLKFVITSPSNDRNWIEEQSVLPSAQIENEQVTLFNIRDFHHNIDSKLIQSYKEQTYDLNTIEGADFILSRFSNSEAIAHTFISFRFRDQPPVAISIESRREKEETYSPLKGLFQAYEIIYVVATERDLIGRRSHIKNEEVYIYPGNTSPQKTKALFLEMITEINKLHQKPAFYNTITNQCTTTLANHIRKVSDRPLPRSYKILLPGYSDQIAYDMGFIQNNIPFETLKKQSLLSPKDIDLHDPNFSKQIRE